MRNHVNAVINVAAAIIIFAASCAKYEESGAMGQIAVPEVEESAFRDFSVILSKAVFNEPQLRAFIKNEALKQFDCDYDVFYPFVKYEEVANGETFESILKRYDLDNKLPSIESAVPKLTILVPDWSWVDNDCFSVKTWDSSDDSIMVAYDQADGTHQLVLNGQTGESLPYGSYIDLPVLIVKSNERMQVDATVKGGGLGYSFIDSRYDNTKHTATKVVYDREFEINLGGGAMSDWVSKYSLLAKVASCKTETDGIPGAAQRDYIYYGMNAENVSGYLDRDILESIYRYSLSPDPDFYFESEDFSSLRTPKLEPNQTMSNSQLKAYSWSNGNIEIRFTINAGFASPLKVFDSCSLSEAFEVVKAIENKHYNFFGMYTSHYYLIRNNCLAPKWVYPGLGLFTWDVANTPVNYTVQAHEVDSGTTHTYSTTTSWQFMTNYTRSTEMGASIELITLKESFGTGSSLTTGGSNTTSVSYTDNDDDLGCFVVQYNDKIVTDEQMTQVKLRSYNTGYIKVGIVPVAI